MTGIRASELRSVLEFTEVLRSCADPAGFSAALVGGIGDVVKSDHASLNEIDVASQEVIGATHPVPLTAREQALVRALMPEHPIVRHYVATASRAVLSLSDFWTQRDLRHSRLYAQYYRPRNIRYQLAMALPGRPGTRRALVVSRSRADFTLRERELLEVVASQAADLEELITIRSLIRLPSAMPAQSRQSAMMVRIQAFIEHHLGDPGLSPAMIAGAHHISVRTLHNLYAAEEHTVTGWIRCRRLERCRQDLLDPDLRDRPVGSVGTRWGFPDAAAFSRVFRRAYGLPPGQYRASFGR